jgi:putative addiction module component (TIGR02574 family)
MTLAQFPQLQKLTRNQKLKLAEELWLAAVDDSKPMSAQHRRLVDGRWTAYRAGMVKRISMAELEARIARR